MYVYKFNNLCGYYSSDVLYDPECDAIINPVKITSSRHNILYSLLLNYQDRILSKESVGSVSFSKEVGSFKEATDTILNGYPILNWQPVDAKAIDISALADRNPDIKTFKRLRSVLSEVLTQEHPLIAEISGRIQILESSTEGGLL